MHINELTEGLQVRYKKNAIDVYTIKQVKEGKVLVTNVHGHEHFVDPEDLFVFPPDESSEILIFKVIHKTDEFFVAATSRMQMLSCISSRLPDAKVTDCKIELIAGGQSSRAKAYFAG